MGMATEIQRPMEMGRKMIIIFKNEKKQNKAECFLVLDNGYLFKISMRNDQCNEHILKTKFSTYSAPHLVGSPFKPVCDVCNTNNLLLIRLETSLSHLTFINSLWVDTINLPSQK